MSRNSQDLRSRAWLCREIARIFGVEPSVPIAKTLRFQEGGNGLEENQDFAVKVRKYDKSQSRKGLDSYVYSVYMKGVRHKVVYVQLYVEEDKDVQIDILANTMLSRDRWDFGPEERLLLPKTKGVGASAVCHVMKDMVQKGITTNSSKVTLKREADFKEGGGDDEKLREFYSRLSFKDDPQLYSRMWTTVAEIIAACDSGMQKVKFAATTIEEE